MGKSLARQYPEYLKSPTVQAEGKRARREVQMKSRFAPDQNGFYMFPQLCDRYNDVYRSVVRRLWDLCTLIGDSENTIQVTLN